MTKEKIMAARVLRKKATKAEQKLWQLLRNREFTNLKFLRQFPITFKLENYQRFFVADFYCSELKLVLEVDGNIHEKTVEQDQARTELLNQLGYTGMRLKNEDLFAKTSDLKASLAKFISKIKESNPCKTSSNAPL